MDSQLRAQLTKQEHQSSSKGEFFVQVRFGVVPSYSVLLRGLSEYGSFGYLVQGTTNHAFDKPCLCLCDTRHFRHFRRFHGVSAGKPLLCSLERKFVIFAVFVRTPSFCRGAKARFTKAPFVGPRLVQRPTWETHRPNSTRTPSY